MKCGHNNFRSHGRTRNGARRWRCRICEKTWSDNQEHRVNRIKPAKEKLILEMLADGKSVREIRAATKCSTQTICKYAPAPQDPPPARRVGQFECDHCGKTIDKKEFHRRTRRTNHKFCSGLCYQAYYRLLRANESCNRCGVKHCELPRGQHKFSRGFCIRCYALLRQFNFDAAAADAWELTRKLKQEICNARIVTHQEHG